MPSVRSSRRERGPSSSLWILGACLVIAGWLTVVTALTFVSPAGNAMAIIGEPAQALAAIAGANGRVLSSSGYVTIARSDEPDFVARLYAAGALLVFDADQAGGCSGGVRRVGVRNLTPSS